MPDPTGFPPRDDADAKAWFYLEHRRDIEAWAAIQGDASLLLERYFLFLAEQLEELAEELNAETSSEDLESGPLPRFGLRRRSWNHAVLGDVTVAAGWDRSNLLRRGNEWPYVGVHVTPDQEDGERRRRITDAVSRLRSQPGMHKSYRWPAWKYVRPRTDAAGVDPEALAREWCSSFRQLWHDSASALDALHPESGS